MVKSPNTQRKLLLAASTAPERSNKWSVQIKIVPSQPSATSNPVSYHQNIVLGRNQSPNSILNEIIGQLRPPVIVENPYAANASKNA